MLCKWLGAEIVWGCRLEKFLKGLGSRRSQEAPGKEPWRQRGDMAGDTAWGQLSPSHQFGHSQELVLGLGHGMGSGLALGLFFGAGFCSKPFTSSVARVCATGVPVGRRLCFRGARAVRGSHLSPSLPQPLMEEQEFPLRVPRC